MDIDEFLPALQSLAVKKDDISGEPLNIKYSTVAPDSTNQRHATPTKYEDEEEDDDETKVHPPSHKHRIHKYKKISYSSLLQGGLGHVHKPTGRMPNILYVY